MDAIDSTVNFDIQDFLKKIVTTVQLKAVNSSIWAGIHVLKILYMRNQPFGYWEF